MNKQVEQIKTEIERCERICDDFISTHTNVIDVGISKAKKNICKHLKAFIDSMQEESKPKFKVGQTITDPTDSTFTFHINKIEDGRYIEKEDEWVLVKEADANYELVEESANEDLEVEFNRFLDEVEGVPRMWHSEEQIEWAMDVARHFAIWQKQQIMKEAINGEVFDNYDKDICQHHLELLVDIPKKYKDGDKVKLIIIKEK